MVKKQKTASGRTTRRISKDISLDVKRLRNMLSAIESEPERYDRVLENPKEQLLEFGIDVRDYGSEVLPPEMIVNEILVMIQQVVEGGLLERIKSLVKVVEATSYSQHTETSYEYNFDNSSETDYKYESHTGTERGTCSETTTGKATSKDTTFGGLSPAVVSEMLRGPLISDLAINQITTQVERTLHYAATKTELIR